MIATVAGYSSTVVAVAGLALRQAGSPRVDGEVERLVRRDITLGVLCAIVATLLWTPPIQLVVARWSGDQVIAYHAAFALMMISATAMRSARTWLLAPHQARRRNALGVGVLVGLLILITGLTRHGGLGADLGDDVVSNSYVFTLYGAHVVAFARYAAREPNSLLRWSMWTICAAACAGLTGLVVEIVAVVLAAVHSQDVTTMNPAAMVLVTLANALGAAGTSLSVWMPAVLRACDRIRGHWLHLALRPLWKVLTNRYPMVVISFRPRDIDTRLLHRVVEIYEAFRLARRDDNHDSGGTGDAEAPLPRWAWLASSEAELTSAGGRTGDLPADDRLDPLHAASGLRRIMRRARRHDARVQRRLARVRPRRRLNGRRY